MICQIWPFSVLLANAEGELLQVVVNSPEEVEERSMGLGRALVCTDEICELNQTDGSQ